MNAEEYLQSLNDDRGVLWYHSDDKIRAYVIFAVVFFTGALLGALYTASLAWYLS